MTDSPRLQGPGRNNDPSELAALVRELVNIKRQVNDLSGSILKAAGIAAIPGKIASSDWDGTDHSALGTVGWVLGRDGAGQSYIALNGTDLAATIAQVSATVTDVSNQQATLTDLVNAQISLDDIAQSASAMAFTTSITTYTSYTFAVPAGFAHATVWATGSGRCLNTTASTQYFFGQTRLDTPEGVWRMGGTQQASIPAGYQATFNAPLSSSVPVVPTHSLTLSVQAWTSAATSSHSGNYVGVDAVVIFTR